MMPDIQVALELQSDGNFEKAAEIYNEFLAINPHQPDVSNLLGLVYLQQNKLEEAKNLFAIATEGFPCAEFFQNLGLVHYKQKNYELAMQCFERVLEYEPNNLDIARDFAQMAKTTNQVEYGIKFFEKALSLEANDYVGWNNLGLLYEKIKEFAKAKSCYINSLKSKKNYEALHNLGVLHRTLRNFDESIKCLKEALNIRPNHYETMISLGMSYLSKKDFKNGRKYYQVVKQDVKENYHNHWDGKEHKDKTLLVYYYAGYGDQIMFSRYFPFLKKYFKHIKIWLPPNVKILIEKNFPEIEFVNTNKVDYDYSTSIMELHFLLNMDFENISSPNGYLTSDVQLTQKYKREYFNTDKRKIGLFWQGNPNVFANRSIKLKELEPIFLNKDSKDSELKFYSFEKDDAENQIANYPQLIDLGATFKNFEDTAAALANLDILITIDSAIAHLAGALGIKTYLMLPYSSEWRWFEDTQITPWYNSVRIFKQEKPYNWQDVVEKIANEIKNIK